MGLWTIRGGNPLYGTVQVQGPRDAVLPLLAACLVHKGVSVWERVPMVADVTAMLRSLEALGCAVKRQGDRVTVDSTHAAPRPILGDPGRSLETTLLLLSALAARFGEASASVPVESPVGPQPVDLQVKAMEQAGAQVRFEEDRIICTAVGMRGGTVTLPYPHRGATMSAMLLACGCVGETILRGCSKSPEVTELAAYLQAAGMTVEGAGTETLTIRPGTSRGSVCHRVQPDPAAAAGLLCAAAACGGKLILNEVEPTHLQPILDVLGEMGCNIKIRENSVILRSEGKLWAPADPVVTGFDSPIPAGTVPCLMAASLRADGVTAFRDPTWPWGIARAKQLRRFGGDVTVTDEGAVFVTGAERLRSAHVNARELRGGAALLIAALQAEGESCIVDRGVLGRGYAYWDSVLKQLGADLEFTD